MIFIKSADGCVVRKDVPWSSVRASSIDMKVQGCEALADDSLDSECVTVIRSNLTPGLMHVLHKARSLKSGVCVNVANVPVG